MSIATAIVVTTTSQESGYGNIHMSGINARYVAHLLVFSATLKKNFDTN
jgi:hypothetical protein